MMNASSFFFSPVLLMLHAVAMTITAIGVVLIVGWAIRYVPAKKLEQIAWWTLGIGIVASIVTCPLLGGSRYGYHRGMMNWEGNEYEMFNQGFGMGMMRAIKEPIDTNVNPN